MKIFKATGKIVILAFAILFAANARAADKQKTSSSTVKAIEWKERQFELQDGKDKITVGDVCAVTLPDRSLGTFRDLRVGERVTVKYHETNGAQFADRIDIEQRPQDDSSSSDVSSAQMKTKASSGGVQPKEKAVNDPWAE